MLTDSWTALESWAAHGITHGAIVKVGETPVSEFQVALVGRSAEEVLAATARLGQVTVLEAMPPALRGQIESQQRVRE